MAIGGSSQLRSTVYMCDTVILTIPFRLVEDYIIKYVDEYAYVFPPYICNLLALFMLVSDGKSKRINLEGI